MPWLSLACVIISMVKTELIIIIFFFFFFFFFFSVRNLAEHENFSANKYENA